MVLVSACGQTTIHAQPLNTSQPNVSTDACAGKQCGENSYCEMGVCMCSGGFKKCGDKCIAERMCCTNDQCPSGKVCSSGVCTDRPLCGFNEQWDSASKQCFCSEGAKFCAEQGKCIEADACCAHNDCNRRGELRCAPTTYSATVCLNYGTKKCRVVHEGVPTELITTAGDFDILLQNVLEGPLFDLKVNTDSIRRVRANESNKISNGTVNLYVESMTVFGGYCRDESD
jgi:hypothetical protein